MLLWYFWRSAFSFKYLFEFASLKSQYRRSISDDLKLNKRIDGGKIIPSRIFAFDWLKQQKLLYYTFCAFELSWTFWIEALHAKARLAKFGSLTHFTCYQSGLNNLWYLPWMGQKLFVVCNYLKIVNCFDKMFQHNFDPYSKRKASVISPIRKFRGQKMHCLKV